MEIKRLQILATEIYKTINNIFTPKNERQNATT